jgi:hypothetical protein
MAGTMRDVGQGALRDANHEWMRDDLIRLGRQRSALSALAMHGGCGGQAHHCMDGTSTSSNSRSDAPRSSILPPSSVILAAGCSTSPRPSPGQNRQQLHASGM